MNIIKGKLLFDALQKHFELVCPMLKKPVGMRKYHANSVYEKIESQFLKYAGQPSQEIFGLFSLKFKEILIGEPAELQNIIFQVDRILKTRRLTFKEFDASTPPRLVHTQLYKDIVHCFNYEAYTSNEYAYHILPLVNVNACPYCNRQFINTYSDNKGKTRAQLDHFYNQSKYPYLAISFYNLIPSCYSCNSSLKKSAKFSIQTHVHPYLNSFENILRFTINYKKQPNTLKYIAEFYANSAFLEIGLEPCVSKLNGEYIKAKNNTDCFRLTQLYNLHKDLIIELLQKEVIYEKSGYATLLKNKYPKLFNDENDIFRLLLGNYYYEKDFNKRPFSRLIRDISLELKLSNKMLA